MPSGKSKDIYEGWDPLHRLIEQSYWNEKTSKKREDTIRRRSGLLDCLVDPFEDGAIKPGHYRVKRIDRCVDGFRFFGLELPFGVCKSPLVLLSDYLDGSKCKTQNDWIGWSSRQDVFGIRLSNAVLDFTLRSVAKRYYECSDSGSREHKVVKDLVSEVFMEDSKRSFPHGSTVVQAYFDRLELSHAVDCKEPHPFRRTSLIYCDAHDCAPGRVYQMGVKLAGKSRIFVEGIVSALYLQDDLSKVRDVLLWANGNAYQDSVFLSPASTRLLVGNGVRNGNRFAYVTRLDPSVGAYSGKSLVIECNYNMLSKRQARGYRWDF